MGEAAAAGTIASKAVVAGGKWLWDHQDKVEPRLKALWRSTKRKIFGPDPGILILGPGGVGKTTLGRILSGRYDFLLDTDAAYEQSIEVQTFRKRGSADVELIVAPGQADRRPATWPDLLRRLSAGKALGVVFCCAYGYHSISTSYKYLSTYDPKKPKAFLKAFLEDRRKAEVEVLDSYLRCAYAKREADLAAYARWQAGSLGRPRGNGGRILHERRLRTRNRKPETKEREPLLPA